jgi:hypothetical protein
VLKEYYFIQDEIWEPFARVYVSQRFNLLDRVNDLYHFEVN